MFFNGILCLLFGDAHAHFFRPDVNLFYVCSEFDVILLETIKGGLTGTESRALRSTVNSVAPMQIRYKTNLLIFCGSSNHNPLAEVQEIGFWAHSRWSE